MKKFTPLVKKYIFVFASRVFPKQAKSSNEE